MRDLLDDRVFLPKYGNRSSEFDYGYVKLSVHNLSEKWAFLCLLFVFILGWYTKYNLMALPNGLTIEDSETTNAADSFIGERAWTDLQILNNFGNRPTGSYNNEVLAVDFLKKEISHIQENANVKQRIHANVQKVSGAYWAAFKPYGMTNVYRNVQNVVVKLFGAQELSGENNATLLLNCHFDSVAGSPGASDDAASCCVMMEILRVLSKQDVVNQYSIIFLFNGAEETPLQASHGFITQHSWAKNIRALINLESVGSGGKEILFQSGPYHSWLIDMYKKSIPYPHGHVAGEELFQSGLIPSDTDFRIFRDFGNVPGLDLAHVINGYRYHTKYDHINYIPMPVLQRTGDNILALTKLIANSNELGITEQSPKTRNVYFDIIGFYFVSYSETFGMILNVMIAVLASCLPYFFMSKTTKGISDVTIRKQIIIGFGLHTLGILMAGGICFLIETELNFFDLTMSWYHHTMFAIALYGFPTIIIMCLVHQLNLTKNKNSPLSLALLVQCRLIGINIFWSIAIVIGTFVQGAFQRSPYVLTIPLAIVLIGNLFIGIFGWTNSIKKWLIVHLIGQIFVILWWTHFYHVVMGIFIPITGRSGGTVNSEQTIAILTCGLTILIMNYLVPLTKLLNKMKKFIITLLCVYVTARLLLQFTNIGFPYRDDSNGYPTPQRLFISHTSRTLYDQQGNIRYSDSGYWLRELDHHTHKTIESLTAPYIPIPQEKSPLCDNEILCALPILSCRQMLSGGFWLAGPMPVLATEGELTLYSISELDVTKRRMQFLITGNVLMSLQIRPKPGVNLTHWDITDKVPEPITYLDQQVYFILITHGVEGSSMNVTMDLEINNETYVEGSLVDISLVTVHWEYHKEHTPEFMELINKLPNWVFNVPSVASVKSWTF